VFRLGAVTNEVDVVVNGVIVVVIILVTIKIELGMYTVVLRDTVTVVGHVVARMPEVPRRMNKSSGKNMVAIGFC
jgi:hypothetical protein